MDEKEDWLFKGGHTLAIYSCLTDELLQSHELSDEEAVRVLALIGRKMAEDIGCLEIPREYMTELMGEIGIALASGPYTQTFIERHSGETWASQDGWPARVMH